MGITLIPIVFNKWKNKSQFWQALSSPTCLIWLNFHFHEMEMTVLIIETKGLKFTGRVCPLPLVALSFLGRTEDGGSVTGGGTSGGPRSLAFLLENDTPWLIVFIFFLLPSEAAILNPPRVIARWWPITFPLVAVSQSQSPPPQLWLNRSYLLRPHPFRESLSIPLCLFFIFQNPRVLEF